MLVNVECFLNLRERLILLLIELAVSILSLQVQFERLHDFQLDPTHLLVRVAHVTDEANETVEHEWLPVDHKLRQG